MPMKIKQIGAGLLAALMILTVAGCKPSDDPVSDSSLSESGSTDPSGETGPGTDSTTDPLGTDGSDPTNPDSSSGSGSTASRPPVTTTSPVVVEPTDSNFVITKDGAAKACIVIPSSPSKKVKTAAEDLQAVLEQITGAKLEIVADNASIPQPNRILVGPTAQTGQLGISQPTGYPSKERVILKRQDNNLVLIGNDDAEYKGTQFAVNMFLERLGCGWYGTQALWHVIKEMKTIEIDQLNVDHTPQFSARISNVFFNYEKFSERWYMGGDEKDVGHNIAKLVPRETYYPSHSEWFALVNGRRDPYSASDTYWQYCYSNKELAKEVAKKLIEIFDQRPNLTNYAIGANDGWEKNWCECSDCTRLGNDTDELLTFANNVAAELKKKYPDKKLTILSYHSIYFPPQSNIKADPMVDDMICSETSMMAPLDLNLKLPTGYNAITHNTYTQSWLDNFKSYIQKASVKTVSIWEWNCIAADKAAWAEIPWVQGNVATRNQKLWKDNGASYIYYDQGPSSTYRENRTSFAVRWPLWYVSSKGMWDGSLTGEDILMDACQKLFGNAANEMFAYYKALADSSELCRSTNTICWVPPEPYEVYTSSRVKIIDAAVNAAKAKMGSVTAVQKERMEAQFQYWNNAKALV